VAGAVSQTSFVPVDEFFREVEARRIERLELVGIFGVAKGRRVHLSSERNLHYVQPPLVATVRELPPDSHEDARVLIRQMIALIDGALRGEADSE